MRALVTALLAGLIFGTGLCVSGMADPKNITAFLDVAGHWSPNLAGVMLGAIAVHAAWLRLSADAGTVPQRSSTPDRARVDSALLGGAALFGVGWGLSGYCPGPAVVALGTGRLAPAVFVAAMLVGMALSRAVTAIPRRSDPAWQHPLGPGGLGG